MKKVYLILSVLFLFVSVSQAETAKTTLDIWEYEPKDLADLRDLHSRCIHINAIRYYGSTTRVCGSKDGVDTGIVNRNILKRCDYLITKNYLKLIGNGPGSSARHDMFRRFTRDLAYRTMKDIANEALEQCELYGRIHLPSRQDKHSAPDYRTSIQQEANGIE